MPRYAIPLIMNRVRVVRCIFSAIVFIFIFAVGHTAQAWTEYPTNPVYDPINSAEKAYYPSLLKMGPSDYRMWYQSNSTAGNTTVAYATSIDGISWTMATSAVSGLIVNNAGHPHVELVDGTFRIWYWNAATPYGNTAMHTAESVDGISWTNDTAITGNLTTPTGGQWNSGIYGAVDVIINNNPTNVGTNPFDYKYVMYFDATSGGYEQIALGYSVDGIAWTLYGTGPVVPKGPAGAWDSGYVAIGSTVIKGTFWTMWYSGGVSASNEGIGCATSIDGLEWTKCPTNPAMSKNDGVAWRNSRTYTPKIIRDDDIYKMWFTGRDVATGNYVIGYATDAPMAVAGHLFLKKKTSGEATLPTNVTNIVLDNESVLSLVNVVNAVNNGEVVIANATTTLSNFTGGDLAGVDLSVPKQIGGKSVAVGKATKLISGSSGVSMKVTNTALATVDVTIPDATTILAPSGWDGIINPPVTAVTSGDTAPTGFSIGTAVDIGSPTEVLLFDKPVQVTLSGVTGSVGYKPAGTTVWTQITATCGGTYDAPSISPIVFPGECAITNGTDTKILSYHLTTFGGLTADTPIPATLHVVKLVVNGSGGTGPGTLTPSGFTVHVKDASGAEMGGGPFLGVAAPGTTYSLSAGTYTISEDVNASYVQSFTVGACSAGVVTLLPGDDKICTIINTDIPAPEPIPPPPPPESSGGGSSSSPVVVAPAIGIVETPNPLTLPAGPGLVTHNYTVWNVGGQKALTDIVVADDRCSPVTLRSGDANINNKLDPGENWHYQCTAPLPTTTINTVTVIGYSDDVYRQPAIASMVFTVVVGAPVTPALVSITNVPSRLTPLPAGGGSVTYTYAVTNPGIVAVSNVLVTDDKCGPVTYIAGDANSNSLIDLIETWTYACTRNVLTSTRNVAMVEGKANGFTALSYAFANVLVSAPGFPEAGPTPANPVFAQQAKALTMSLRQGNRSNNVKVLQQFLITLNKGPAAQALARVGATSYFGSLTRAALAEFQASVGIRPAWGNFGPITRAYLKANF